MKRIALFFLMFSSLLLSQKNYLLLSSADIDAIRKDWSKYEVFKKTYTDAKRDIDAAMNAPVDVPVPKDAAGYTHERHKQNYTLMYNAGQFYAFTGDSKYAEFVKTMLTKYAALYPTLKKHPAATSESPGKLFWQSLNETVWLFYSIQAYDFVKDYLKPEEQNYFEDNIFRKMAQFFMVERAEEFNLIHNHGTWSVAAVGMTGIVLHDTDMVQKSLLGSDKAGKGGFLRQVNDLFSPDGYYREGAYYARYALLPFFTFAEALAINKPELKIFEYKNQVLKKGLYAALQLTYTNGSFLPINDAIKDKNFLSPEIAVALDIVYRRFGEDRSLLWVAKQQNIVSLNYGGLLVAKALSEASSFEPFPYTSCNFSDGPDGKDGGIALLRTGSFKEQSLLSFKYTSHGLSHGHYDKLSICYYDQGKEILQDYGAARFINIDPKYGGRYLPENKSFAMLTVAHNTIVADEKSQYSGKREFSDKYSPYFRFYQGNDNAIQAAGAADTTAYPGIKLLRSLFLVNDPAFSHPVVIDVLSAFSEKEHQFDLPFYYLGHFITTNVEYKAFDKERKPMGKANGYQHLWKEAEGVAKDLFSFTWLNGEGFYSISSAADSASEIFFTRIGASDPKFNLRNEPGLMIRKKGTTAAFVSVIEPHGKFDDIHEFTAGVDSKITGVKTLINTEEMTVAKISAGAASWYICVWNNEKNSTAVHHATVDGREITWNGYFTLLKN
jgi:hypothetical protein